MGVDKGKLLQWSCSGAENPAELSDLGGQQVALRSLHAGLFVAFVSLAL